MGIRKEHSFFSRVGISRRILSCMRGRWLLLAVSVLTAFALISCQKKAVLAKPSTPTVLKAEVAHDEFAMRVLASAEELDLEDQLELAVEAEAPETWNCLFPDLEPSPENFLVLDSRDEAPQLLDSGKLRHRRLYRLEPLPGEHHEIPPLTVRFARAQDGTEPVELESEGFSITVDTLSVDAWEKLDIDDQQGMEPVKAPLSRRTLWTIAIAVVAVVFLLWLALRRRHDKLLEPPPPPPAYQTALQAFQRLLDEKLLDKGEFKLLHIKLSDILRHYLEARFQLPATEQTTEEFLHDLATPGSPLQEHRQQLREFLRHCDMVKFAEHVPQVDEIQRMAEVCRQLILSTGKEEETITAKEGEHAAL